MTTTLSPLSKLSCKNMLVLLAVPLLSAGVLFGGATLVILNIPALKAYAVPIISAVVFVQALFWLWYMNAFRKQHALNWSDV